MSREGELAKNTVILSLGTFLPKVASIVVLPILTGCLTKEEYGTYDLITILVSLLLPALTLQIQAGAFRFLISARHNNEKAKEIISSVFCFITIVSILGLSSLFILYKSNSWLIKLVICLYYLADVWMNSSLQCARGLGKNLYYSIASISSAIIQLILSVVLVRYFRGGLLGAATMLLASALTSVVYLYFFGGLKHYISLASMNPTTIKSLLAYSWPMVPNSMSMWAMRSINRLIIIYFLGTAANAVFAVSFKIPQIAVLAQGAFSMAWQENASLASEDSDSGQYYAKMFRTVFRMMAGITTLIIAAAPALFTLLIHGDYAESYSYIPILFVAVFFSTISSFLGGIYVAHMKTFNVGMSTVIAAIINAIMCWVGIPVFGLIAASLAMVLSFMFLALYRMVNIRKFVQIRFNYLECLSVLLFIIVLCFLCSVQMIWTDIVCAVLAFSFAFTINRPLICNVISSFKEIVNRMGKQRL